jgi:hypothetical protein
MIFPETPLLYMAPSFALHFRPFCITNFLRKRLHYIATPFTLHLALQIFFPKTASHYKSFPTFALPEN